MIRVPWIATAPHPRSSALATQETTYEYIERVPGVVGGDPVIKGTRVPVWSIVLHAQAHGGLDRITEAYPRVSREAAEEALAYYEAHRAEIDTIIAENEAIANSPSLDE